MRRSGYDYGREWAYKNVKPCIIAEKYMEDGRCGGGQLPDYKFYSFNGGDIKCIFCGCDRFTSIDGVHVNMYDTDWNRLPFEHGHPSIDIDIARPEKLEEMLALSKQLGKEVNNSFVRIDFYEVNHIVYFGEFTFYPGGGFEIFKPLEWDYTLGSWLSLDS